jgi:hypothetical protein
MANAPVYRNANLEAKRIERLRIEAAEHALRSRRKSKTSTTENLIERFSDLKAFIIGREAEFDRLVRVCKTTKILDYSSRVGGEDHPYQVALGKLAKYAALWVRQPEDWVCKTKSLRRQFSSLAFHLFAKYPVPEFLNQAWFSSGRNSHHANWYILVSQGSSVRKLPMVPNWVTKAVAHWFTQTPADIRVEHAFRWAQVVSLGGDDRLARAIIAVPRLCGSFINREPEFWETVVRFFIANPMIDHSQIGPIVDFIYNQKFEPAGFQQPPPHPNFCMKGRTVESLMTQMTAWHRLLGRNTGYNRKQFIEWQGSGIPGGEYEEGKGGQRVHVIRELLNSTELREEGTAMRHCVASYVGSCSSGQSAIFSLFTRDCGLVQRRLTIEVRLPSREIVQARGRFNALPTDLDKRILRLWSAKTGLRMDQYIV